MTAYRPIRNKRIYEQIVAQIEQQILSGELKVGDKLPTERVLAQQFQVSRTAVREAIKALRGKGLVDASPGRGTFVTNGISRATSESMGLLMKMAAFDTPKDRFADLFEVRRILEPEIAAIAALRATSEQIEEMQKAVELMDGALDDMDKYIEADTIFHQLIAKATQNELLPAMIEPIMDLLLEQRKTSFQTGSSPMRSLTWHKKILEAIINQNPLEARKAMSDHLDQVVDDIDKKE